jgi:hypothetical protein
VASVSIQPTEHEAFGTFVSGAESRLRQALVARYGLHVGDDAVAAAITYGLGELGDDFEATKSRGVSVPGRPKFDSGALELVSPTIGPPSP